MLVAAALMTLQGRSPMNGVMIRKILAIPPVSHLHQVGRHAGASEELLRRDHHGGRPAEVYGAARFQVLLPEQIHRRAGLGACRRSSHYGDPHLEVGPIGFLAREIADRIPGLLPR